LGSGRQVDEQQKIHSSVLSLGAAYKPSAELPEGRTLNDLVESDAFENARSILGSLLRIGSDGSEQLIVPENIDYQITELLKHADKGVSTAHI
jgi:hypothetical protein